MFGFIKKIGLINQELKDTLAYVDYVKKLNVKFNCSIHEKSHVYFQNLEHVQIGKGVVIQPFSVVYCLNEADKNNSFLIIGEDTYIGEQNNIRAGGGKITIGKKCLISQQVSIIASNHSILLDQNIMDQPWDEANNFVTIGDDVWVGCSVQILPGVTIGNGAVIGAGSVVTRDVEPNSIVVGNPARHLKYRSK